MRLRKQLFIASLFTLSLPWVGCQYIKEMEENLRSGQNDALKATAKAVTSTIENDNELRQELLFRSASKTGTSIYAHQFKGPPTLDGYNEDWLSHDFQQQTFDSLISSPNTDDLKLTAAIYLSQLWLFFDIPDPEIDYFDPSSDIEQSDRLQITLDSTQSGSKPITILANTPGQVLALRNNEALHQIKGVWRETNRGYQVELRLPLEWAQQGLGFDVFNRSPQNSKGLHTFSNRRDTKTTSEEPLLQLPVILTQSEKLNQVLRVFSRDDISLQLAASNGAFTASTQATHSKNQDLPQRESPWLLGLIYKTVLNNNMLPALPKPQNSGFFSNLEVINALLGRESQNQYQHQGQTVSAVSIPVRANNKIIGAVLAIQNTKSLTSFTDSAFSRLLIYSILVSLGSALTLVSYASWLSFRIGRLNRSSHNAISDTGKITENFKASKLDDELGELSRSFAQLLGRLREYTHYLKTLSSKLSHELRTPLAIVSSSLDNLEHETLSEQARIYANRAKEGCSRLSTILNSMSAASRVEQAIGSAEFEALPLDEMLKSLVAAYSDIYPNAKFELKINDHKEGFLLQAAGELLVQMLDKLVDNAADFCPAQGQIELGLNRDDENITITVRNEGPTLPHTMHRQLFDSMVSVRKPTADTHHLGLGLYIVRLIVDLHSGHVECYNAADNSGVVFEIKLPRSR